MWTGVTGFHCALLTHSRPRSDSIGSPRSNHTHFRNYFTNCRNYQLYWQRCWNCPPSVSIHFWHQLIKFPITRCSSPLLMLISSRILHFSSSRVRGFVLYTAFLNLPHSLKFVIQIMDCWTWWNFYPANWVSKSLHTCLADWVNDYWSYIHVVQ